MMTRRKQTQWLLAMVLVLGLAPTIVAQKRAGEISKAKEESQSAVVWHDPGDVSTLNLLYGAGGKDHAPDPNGRFTFVEEDLDGGSPKFSVRDENGVQWKVKLGEETQSETVATRILWAAGYFVDADYYLVNLKVEGLPKLRRGQDQVAVGGMVQRARLERNSRNVKKIGNWDWFHNQCGSEREMNGLRVMMAFMNNWDLKAVNNSLEDVDGQRRCAVTDLGATFGKTGNVIARSKSTLKDYTASKFISNVRPQSVDLVMHTRPFFLSVFSFSSYLTRTRMQGITKRIPLADARWMGERLALLSLNQIHDGFRAAGYTPEQVDVYTKAVQARIAELNAL